MVPDPKPAAAPMTRAALSAEPLRFGAPRVEGWA